MTVGQAFRMGILIVCDNCRTAHPLAGEGLIVGTPEDDDPIRMRWDPEQQVRILLFTEGHVGPFHPEFHWRQSIG